MFLLRLEKKCGSGVKTTLHIWKFKVALSTLPQLYFNPGKMEYRI